MTDTTHRRISPERARRRLELVAAEMGFPVDEALAERVVARFLFLVPYVERMHAWRAAATGALPVQRHDVP